LTEEKIMLRQILDSFNGLWAACVLSVALLAPVIPLWAATSTPTPPQAFVKLDQEYLLYTAPIVPYLDRSGTMMVGVAGVARALYSPQTGFGRVQDDPQKRTETLTLGDRRVTFRDGSATATTVEGTTAEGKPVPLGVPARWDAASKHMVVGAAGLARCLGLTCRWDGRRRVLTVTAPPAIVATNTDGYFAVHFGMLVGHNLSSDPNLPSDPITPVDPNTPVDDPDVPVDPGADYYDYVVPWRVAYHASGLPADANLGAEGNTPRRLIPWLSMEARNVSGGLILQEALNVEVLYDNGLTSGNVEGPTVPDKYSHYGPNLWPGQVRRFAVALQRVKDTAQGPLNAPLCVISIPLSQHPLTLTKPSVRVRKAQPAATREFESLSPPVDADFIDPSIVGQERTTVAAAMANLPQKDRRNVIVYEPDGTVYANRPWLRTVFSTLHQLNGNVYEDSRGHMLTLPAPQQKPGRMTSTGAATPLVANPSQPYTTSGPYIRFYTTPPASDTAQGFAHESASVTLPGVTSQSISVSENPVDAATATIYIGGWGATPNEALDMGFSHETSHSKFTAAGWNDDWVAFWGLSKPFSGNPTNPDRKEGTNTGSSVPVSQATDAIRFRSNQTATLEFSVTGTAANPQLNFIWGGTFYDYKTLALIGNDTFTLVAYPGAVSTSGWSPQGNGMILKSMTSIAQESGGSPATDTLDGSFLMGVNWSLFKLCQTGTGTLEDPSYFPNNGNAQFFPSNGSVNITSSGVSPGTANNDWDRTDGIVVP
jgi:hypothetical protein